MHDIKIEKGVPMPDCWERYPFDQMEVSDSFFVPGVPIGRIVMLANTAQQNLPMRFNSRKEGDGVRVWRVR